ncbi:MAG TPA: flagellar biosynthesis protein FlhF [Gammaproteobacteria bacterium]|nr:flagellar biosynthesis protein FlhF [Gammaproteobacteria bacterium]
MNIQRFIGSDSRSAMRKVKEALGDDALILSNRQVPDGIEIVAADGNDDSLFGENDMPVVEYVGEKTNSQQSYTVQTEIKSVETKSTETKSADQDRTQAPSLGEFIQSEKLNAFSGSLPTADTPYTGLGAATKQDPPVLQPVISGNTTAPGKISNAGEKTNNFTNTINKAKSALRTAKNHAPSADINEDPQISSMREELSRLRGMMENQFSNMHMGLWAKSSPARASVLQRMTELGLTENLATKIVSSLKNIDNATPQLAARDALAALAKEIKVTGDKIFKKGGTIVFIGPAGAGKTTTIAKLALQFTQQHGNDDIVLISTDTSRFGAHEQLAAYGRLLGIPVLRATEKDQIRELISAMQDKKMVLVDTAGLTQQDLRNAKNIPTMALQIPNIQHYLVMPATAQYQILDRIISSFSHQDIAGAIMTKLDEAANLGELLSSAISNKLPISYWTEESKITSSLHVANPRQLVEKAVSTLRSQTRSQSAPRTEINDQNHNHHQQP